MELELLGGRRGGKNDMQLKNAGLNGKERRTLPMILNRYPGPAGNVLWAYLGLCFDRTLSEQERRAIEVVYLGHRE